MTMHNLRAKIQLSGNLTTVRQWKRQEIKRALISQWVVKAIVKENNVRFQSNPKELVISFAKNNL